MKNIKILKTGIDVSKIRKQLEKYPEDWGSQQKLKNVKLKDPHEYITSVDVLQLVMGGITTPGEEVGNTEIKIRDLLRLNEGSVVELDRLAGEPLDILANGTMIAKGEVVMVGERFGIRLTEVVDPEERVQNL